MKCTAITWGFDWKSGKRYLDCHYTYEAPTPQMFKLARKLGNKEVIQKGYEVGSVLHMMQLRCAVQGVKLVIFEGEHTREECEFLVKSGAIEHLKEAK